MVRCGGVEDELDAREREKAAAPVRAEIRVLDSMGNLRVGGARQMGRSALLASSHGAEAEKELYGLKAVDFQTPTSTHSSNRHEGLLLRQHRVRPVPSGFGLGRPAEADLLPSSAFQGRPASAAQLWRGRHARTTPAARPLPPQDRGRWQEGGRVAFRHRSVLESIA